MAISPFKTDTILPVNAQAPLSFTITFQGFKPVAGRMAQIINSGRSVKLFELAASNTLKGAERTHRLPVEQALGALVFKCSDHR